MRLIVTGAAGVLGSELIEQTLRADPQVEIVAVTRQPQALTRRWQGYANMKCCSWDELAQMPLAGGDVIVHGAFPRQENGQELTEALDLTGTLLKKAGTSGKEIAWVDISSRSVYGQNEQTPWTETAELMPASPYALAKAAQELLTRQAAEAYGYQLGMAFQIRDDMLDVIGDEAAFGKPIGSDRADGKTTYVDVLGLEGCENAVAMCTAAAKAALARLPEERWADIEDFARQITAENVKEEQD